jgi:hypothetical protein
VLGPVCYPCARSVPSHRRWYDFSRARDAMFAATDTEFAPWYVVNANDARRARLNCIRHLLSKLPYQELPREHVKLTKRQPADATSSRAGAGTSFQKSTDACRSASIYELIRSFGRNTDTRMAMPARTSPIPAIHATSVG